MFRRKVILHATDFSPQSAYTLEVARALARESGSELVLLHVVPTVFDKSRPAAERKLAELVTSDRSVVMRSALLVGDPAAKILWLARELRCDLIVLGRQGRTAWQALLSRSVNRQLENRAPCPVVSFCAPQAWLDAQAWSEEGPSFKPLPDPSSRSIGAARHHRFRNDRRFTAAKPGRFPKARASAPRPYGSNGHHNGS
jgi:nucleotide-binding universal stress UspA family protein